jgi:hypothetical protein
VRKFFMEEMQGENLDGRFTLFLLHGLLFYNEDKGSRFL